MSKTITIPTGLCRVKRGDVLVVPRDMFNTSPVKTWLLGGGVIDMDDRFTQFAVAGQESRLEPAPPGAVVSKIRHDGLRARRIAWERKEGLRTVPATPRENVQAKANAAAVAAGAITAADPAPVASVPTADADDAKVAVDVTAGGVQRPDTVAPRAPKRPS